MERPDEGELESSVLLGERIGSSATTAGGVERPDEGGLGTAVAAADKAGGVGTLTSMGGG